MSRIAFVTGITGQDGSYLAELLLAKGYEVHGLIRRASTFNTGRINHVYQDPHHPERRLFLHYGDLTDGSMLARLLAEIRPDEIYNLGAQSHVGVSFDMPEYTANVTALGTLRLLESVREAQVRPRIYQASSSEMFGNVPPQREDSGFDPASPYAAAKVFAHHVAGLLLTVCTIVLLAGADPSPPRGPWQQREPRSSSITAGASEIPSTSATTGARWNACPSTAQASPWRPLQADDR